MKPFFDEGHRVRATKPLALRRYQAGKLPDAAQCVDCLIIVNDQYDGVARGRLAISNGATWDHVAWIDDVGSGSALAVVPQPRAEVDLTPLVRAAVDAALPGLMPPAVKVVEHVRDQALPPAAELGKLREDIRALAVANLEISEHLQRVIHENAELMARIEYVEQNAIARAELEVR